MSMGSKDKGSSFELEGEETNSKDLMKTSSSTVPKNPPALDVKSEELYKEVQGILNKLSPRTFEVLVKQVKDLDINTEERLKGVVDLIYEKAIGGPNFTILCANMCRQLALLQVPLSKGEGFVKFRKLLLTKCQRTFEQDRSKEFNRVEKKMQIEECNAEDKDKAKQLQEEYKEEEQKNRRRQLGNIRFIGELFKLGMLIEPIMHECIRNLLSQGDEDSLECLCRLLTTIGKELFAKKDRDSTDEFEMKKEAMNQYFREMQKIVDKRQTSTRVQSMLQNVIELKNRYWNPGTDENNSKTIDQIHKVEKEAQEQQQIGLNMTFTKRSADDRCKSATSGPFQGHGSDHDQGLNTMSKSAERNISMDTSKLQLTGVQLPRSTDTSQRAPMVAHTIQNRKFANQFLPNYRTRLTRPELYKKVQDILNRLTPQKFEVLVKQVKDLDIDTEERLKGVVDLIYEKAIDDPNFTALCANMCKQLALLQESLSEGEGFVKFRSILFKKCEREFEQDSSDELNRAEKKQIEECSAEDKAKQLQEEYEQEEQQNRRLKLGNIRFIGELFKLGMLIELIIHEWNRKLLNQASENSLEGLCCLLKIVGKELYTKKERESTEDFELKKEAMNQYLFREMQKIIDKRQASPRVRNMLQDVIELRNQNWNPRRDENNPKNNGVDPLRRKERAAADSAEPEFF